MAAECCRGGAQHGAEISISLRKVKLKENALHIVCLALILVVLVLEVLSRCVLKHKDILFCN